MAIVSDCAAVAAAWTRASTSPLVSVREDSDGGGGGGFDPPPFSTPLEPPQADSATLIAIQSASGQRIDAEEYRCAARCMRLHAIGSTDGVWTQSARAGGRRGSNRTGRLQKHLPGAE